MSCILVGLSTLKIDPNQLTVADIVWSVSRDFLLIAWHSALVIWATRQEDRSCTNQSNVFSWMLFDISISLLRLIKNPLQFQANKIMDRNGSNWVNPEDMSNSWIFYFSPSYLFCQMRLYTLIDWMTYLSWILGAWAVHLVEGCRSNFIVNAVYYEISFSTLFYVGSIVTYILAFGLHRLSSGRCLPGLSIRNAHWPDRCPSLHFDRSQWRRQGESLSEYRVRVVEAFDRQDSVQIQPMPMNQMIVEDMRLRPDELNQLPTLRYSPSSNALASLPSTQTLVAKEERQERATQSGLDSVVTSPSILTIEPTVPTPLLASPSQENVRTTDDTCALCLEDYEVDEVLRELRCGHRYHASCVDEWLTRTKRTCPVCNADALLKAPNES
jgi:hypothetical protein